MYIVFIYKMKKVIKYNFVKYIYIYIIANRVITFLKNIFILMYLFI